MILRHTFSPPDNTRMAHLCGPMDSHIRSIEAALQVKVAHRFEQFRVEGPKAKAQRAMEVLQALYEMARGPIPPEQVQLMLSGDTALQAMLTQAAAGAWTAERFGPLAHAGRGDAALRAWFSDGWADFLAPVVMGADSPAERTDELRASFCAADPDINRRFAMATFLGDNRADLPQVTRPCLILQHQEDSLVPLAVGEYLNQQLKGSTLEVMDVAGHAAHMSHPALVIDAMRRYMAEVHA